MCAGDVSLCLELTSSGEVLPGDVEALNKVPNIGDDSQGGSLSPPWEYGVFAAVGLQFFSFSCF